MLQEHHSKVREVGYNKALQEVRFIPSLKLPASREENG